MLNLRNGCVGLSILGAIGWEGRGSEVARDCRVGRATRLGERGHQVGGGPYVHMNTVPEWAAIAQLCTAGI